MNCRVIAIDNFKRDANDKSEMENISNKDLQNLVDEIITSLNDEESGDT